MDNSWLLRVRNLTKIHGEATPGVLERTGPKFGSNICPRTGAVVACSNISFDLYPGEVLGIVGESGSGKSSLVQMLYFDQEATSGEARFKTVEEGTVNLFDLSNQKKRHIRNHLMGMIYQNPRDGLNFRFSSGGKIAEIAKAIANHPPRLLLDEVTSELDVSVQAKVLDLIRGLQQDMGVSMIVVSHDLGVIRMLTDRTMVLKNGHIVE